MRSQGGRPLWHPCNVDATVFDGRTLGNLAKIVYKQETLIKTALDPRVQGASGLSRPRNQPAGHLPALSYSRWRITVDGSAEFNCRPPARAVVQQAGRPAGGVSPPCLRAAHRQGAVPASTAECWFRLRSTEPCFRPVSRWTESALDIAFFYFMIYHLLGSVI